MRYFVERINSDKKNSKLFYEIKAYILSMISDSRVYPNYKTKYTIKSESYKTEFIFKYTKKSVSLCLKKKGIQKTVSLSKGYDLVVETIESFLERPYAKQSKTVISKTSSTKHDEAYSSILSELKERGCLESYLNVKRYITSRYKKVRYSESTTKQIIFYISKRKYPKLEIKVLKKGVYAVVTKYSSGFTKKYKLVLNKKNEDKIIGYIDTMYNIESFAFAKKRRGRRNASSSKSTRRNASKSASSYKEKVASELPDDIFDIEG